MMITEHMNQIAEDLHSNLRNLTHCHISASNVLLKLDPLNEV